MGTMYEVSDNVYDASFPSLECLPVNYWFSAQDTEGSRVQLILQPSASVYSDIVVTYEDDCETDTGWSVSGSRATDGQWDRGIPINCDRGDPPADGDGSGSCWLTDNSSRQVPCNSDVDGGSTILTSPVLDASDPGTVISYTYWYSNDFGGDPNNDFFTIEASDDGWSSSWETVEVIGPAAAGGWVTSSFGVSSIPGLSPSETFRLRFTAEDAGGSVIEAGVDGIMSSASPSARSSETVPATIDGNDTVNVNDLLLLIGAWGNPYDVDDLLEVIGNWGDCS